MLYEQITKERSEIIQKLEQLQSQLQQFPDGKLICCHDKTHWKWYQSDGHTKAFIPKSNRPLAEKLALKKYLSYLYTELSSEVRALDFYLKHHKSENDRSSSKLLKLPAYHELLSPYLHPYSAELSEWMNSPYHHNPKHQEQLIHETLSGHTVRSKSEAMIALLLYMNQIPFRYECELALGSATLYPDFTIRHPKTGNFFYWEHFGRMDDSSYRKNIFSKLQLYSDYEIIPSINLITTYETPTHPLTAETIEKMIREYFS